MRCEMYNDLTLGFFSYKKGGHIFLEPGLNMEYDSGSASCMHEMYHEYLALRTNVGILLYLIELEIESCVDDEYRGNLFDIRKVLYDATRDIHEIYANSQEMLWLQENYTSDVWKKIRAQKTEQYQNYLGKLEHIWNNSNKTIHERRKKIDVICKWVLDLDIFSEMFWNNLMDPYEREIRINALIEKRIYRAFTKGVNHDEVKELNIEAIEKLVNTKFRYLSKYFSKNYQRALDRTDVDLNGLLLETISTFEIPELGIKIKEETHGECDVLFMIHNVRTNRGDFDNALIQFSKSNGEYILLDVSENKMKDMLSKQKYIVVQEKDFNYRTNKPRYIECKNIVFFVLINEFKNFRKCMSEILEYEEIYIGDLNEKSQKNFFTIFFARKRNCENVIYIFPTISVLADKFIEELNLEKQIRRPGSGSGFYDIFSAFDNWIEILQVINNIVAFATKSKGNILNVKNKSAPLLDTVKRDIGNNMLKIEVENSFKIRAALPTLFTCPEPFWIIMEFFKGECTGNICSYKKKDVIQGEHASVEKEVIGIIFFDNKNLAINYAKLQNDEQNDGRLRQVVGLDDVAWRVLKPYLKKEHAGMVYYFQENKGKWMDIEHFEYYRNKMK